jgi:DNA-binding MarR family transcriptional regulator
MSAPAELDALLNEVRLLWHRLVQVGQRLHGPAPITLGMRAVLEYLAREGPATVPGIARSRHVTRQHIQALVNALLEAKLVELGDNPAHKRSPLVGLTPEGRRRIGRMKAKEARLLARSTFGVSQAELQRAAATLRAVRAGLGGRQRR